MNEIALSNRPQAPRGEPLYGERRDIRAVSYALCSAVFGVLVMRIVSYFAALPSDTYGQTLLGDMLFSLPVQLVFFLIVPFCIYKFYGKRSVRAVLEYGSVGAFKPYFLLALPLGLFVYFLTLGVSSAWQALLGATGYAHASAATPLPDGFVAGFFVAEIVMTAVLPAVCEEFVMRGGLLTTARKSLGIVGCVVLGGVAFGLFHQNVRQVFYTSLFGALTVFLTYKTKSLYPAMLMHFVNNFCGVFFEYAEHYGWPVFGGLWSMINELSAEYPWLLFIVFAAVAGAALGIVVIMLYCREKRVIRDKTAVIKDSAFDATNKRVVIMGEFDPARIESLEMQREVYGKDYREQKYKPTLRDLALIAALATVTVVTTVFTYVWGFFY